MITVDLLPRQRAWDEGYLSFMLGDPRDPEGWWPVEASWLAGWDDASQDWECCEARSNRLYKREELEVTS